MEEEYKKFLQDFRAKESNRDTIVFEFHGIVEEPFAKFSNFVESPFELDGKQWPSANHFFQAAKFFGADDDWANQIRLAETPFEASRMGKSRAHPIQDNWAVKRDEWMKRAVFAKFEQNQDLKTLLLSTGNASILCHNFEDGWWGDGVGCGGSHLNKLGKLLEDARSHLNSM